MNGNSSNSKRVRTILRVVTGNNNQHIGDILLDEQQRVWRHAPSIPPSVVLCVLKAHTTGQQTQGEVTSPRDRRVFTWGVVEAVA